MDERVRDLAECVRGALSGDEDAARDLMDQLYPLVVKIVRGHLPRRIHEEDLVQMVFMKVFANLDRFTGAVPITHWVSRIAVNTCLNALKAEQARPEWRWSDLSEEEQYVMEASAAGNLAPSETTASSARELLDKVLAELNPSDRLVIQLIHLEERTVAEAARLTGWSEPVVKIRAFRARHKMKRVLTRLMREEKQ